MPTYEYECPKCKAAFVADPKISDPPLKTCPTKRCQGEPRRLISGTGSFVLKGGGWYKDGY